MIPKAYMPIVVDISLIITEFEERILKVSDRIDVERVVAYEE
jgi:hypothetical protein